MQIGGQPVVPAHEFVQREGVGPHGVVDVAGVVGRPALRILHQTLVEVLLAPRTHRDALLRPHNVGFIVLTVHYTIA